MGAKGEAAPPDFQKGTQKGTQKKGKKGGKRKKEKRGKNCKMFMSILKFRGFFNLGGGGGKKKVWQRILSLISDYMGT